MSYPSILTYFMDRMSGFSTNTFKLFPQNQTSAVANQIIRVTLPSNSLLDLRSFALFFSASTTGEGARLPADISTLVNRVSISIGGIELQSGFNDYNVFKHAKAVFCGHAGDPANSHPSIVREVSYVDMKGNNGTSLLTGVQPEAYPSDNNQTQFCIDNWEGFLGSLEPRLFDSSLVGDIVVSIYLADNAVLTTSKTSL